MAVGGLADCNLFVSESFQVFDNSMEIVITVLAKNSMKSEIGNLIWLFILYQMNQKVMRLRSIPYFTTR